MIKHKTNSPNKLTSRLLPRLRLAILSIIIFMALFSVIVYVGKIFKNSDYFKIKDIVVNKGNAGVDFSYLVGHNVFNIDLNKESGYISELYPAYSNIRLIRVLPNRLFVGFTERKAIAYIKLYRYFCVDKDSVLLSLPQEVQEFQLPVILGLETKIFGAKPGRQYNIKELTLALDIIKEIKINSLSRNYMVQKIDVTSFTKASCFIIPLEPPDSPQGKNVKEFNGLEVRVGQDNISDKVRVLAGLFIQLKSELKRIKYIDLRFKVPVIKFKDNSAL